MNAIAAVPTMFNASIVVVNHTGRSAFGKSASPRTPVTHEQDHECHEPANGLPHLDEHERAERRQAAPERDASGREEPADQHLSDRRRKHHVEELRHQEGTEVPGPREEHQRADRDREVDERDDADHRAEAEVQAAPDERDGQDQHGEQDEERLLGAQVVVVLGAYADAGSGAP